MTTEANLTEPIIPTAAVLVIGDEILSGRTLDTNIGTIARFLSERGVDLKEVRVVADDEDAIVAAVNALRRAYRYVFTTGGIGPTHDDITAASIARAFGLPLILDPRAVAILQERYGARPINEARLKMARLPNGSALIPNAVSGAPGFIVENVHVMAGIPAVMKAMLEALADVITPGPPMQARTLPAAIGEGTIAAGLAAIQGAFPDVAIGSYPQIAATGFATEIVLRSRNLVRLEQAAEQVAALLQTALADATRDRGF